MLPQQHDLDSDTPSILRSLQIAETEDIADLVAARTQSSAVPIPISQNFGHNVTGRPPSDVMFLSKDCLLFYADEHTLLQSSNNNFKGLLPLNGQEMEERIIFLKDLASSELEIILQAIYHAPSSKENPTGGNLDDFRMLARGIGWLPTFGVPPKSVVLPFTPLFDRILLFAPLYPLEVYALAGQYGMEDLAVAVSTHTIPVELWNVTEELAERMGASYLLRLFRLHMERESILKAQLEMSPDLHAPTEECGFDDQRALKRKWNTGVAFLAAKIKADTSTTLIREALMAHTGDITCEDCVKARDTRLNSILSEWSLAVRSI
ncbi:hypothetical protein Moror_2684 [Moniliophthora roreri MCA 2997]|uniref:BTB domain-containing protein n=1 Tax=Moniliophthora roreri (strain MCA 2997) TaxID=1381753 RepID=V2XG16_MONRO|nr:hypothetical protein Moror_2684 [Moniliophthora roreri MCA 2997]